MKLLDDQAVRRTNYLSPDADWITFDETTCTSPDQISIAPGYLQKEWSENGRRCFHYVMDKPILDFYATLSARYTVKREKYKGVNLEIYYTPQHVFALPSMIQASKDGLDYFSAHFSPYLYRQYRILYAVHLVLHSKKLKGDSLGNAREVPIGDYVDVGVFGAHVPGQ